MKEPFIKLYDDYFDDVYRYIYSKLGNKWDTDDAVSDTFRKALENYSKLRNPDYPKAWLLTIARNTVMDVYRRKKVREPGGDPEEAAHPQAVEELVLKSEELSCLKRSVLVLAEEDQEIIRLHYFAELKYREIGALLEKSEEAIKTRVFRAIKKLHILVKSCLEGGNPHGRARN